MSSVRAATAAQMAAVEGQLIVGGAIVGNDLVLTKKDTTTVNVGVAKGPQGYPSGGDVVMYSAKNTQGNAVENAVWTTLGNSKTAWTYFEGDASLFTWLYKDQNVLANTYFRPNKAGLYLIQFTVGYASNVAGGRRIPGIWKNGVEQKRSDVSGANYSYNSVSHIMPLALTDRLVFMVWNSLDLTLLGSPAHQVNMVKLD